MQPSSVLDICVWLLHIPFCCWKLKWITRTNQDCETYHTHTSIMDTYQRQYSPRGNENENGASDDQEMSQSIKELTLTVDNLSKQLNDFIETTSDVLSMGSRYPGSRQVCTIMFVSFLLIKLKLIAFVNHFNINFYLCSFTSI